MPEQMPSGDRTMGLYAIYDLVAGEILQNCVWLFPHVAPARRMFQDACTAPPEKSRIAQHPGDYALVYLGLISTWTLSVMDVCTFDRFVDAQHPAVLCRGDQVVA
jgi:hypothetical protein